MKDFHSRVISSVFLHKRKVKSFYRNFHHVRCYFLHLLPHVRPMRESALSMDFAKNCPTFLMSRFIQPSILLSSILYYQIF